MLRFTVNGPVQFIRSPVRNHGAQQYPPITSNPFIQFHSGPVRPAAAHSHYANMLLQDAESLYISQHIHVHHVECRLSCISCGCPVMRVQHTGYIPVLPIRIFFVFCRFFFFFFFYTRFCCTLDIHHVVRMSEIVFTVKYAL